jgi:hypothetical protein
LGRDEAPPAATPAAIDAAIERGVDYLRREQRPDGTWAGGSQVLGHTALGALALLHAGLVEDGRERGDRTLARALSAIDAQGPGRGRSADRDPGTYATSLLLLALRDRGREVDVPRMQRLADLLVRTQADNGQWGYSGEPGDSGRDGPEVGDNSNAQFAVLALGAAVGEGLKVPPEAVARARAWWRSAAQPDGGFGYSSGGGRKSESSGSMTGAGIACLAVLEAASAPPASAPAPSKDPVLLAAVKRLEKGFSVERNFGPATGAAGERQRSAGRGWLHYYLWTLERAMVLAGIERLEGATGTGRARSSS